MSQPVSLCMFRYEAAPDGKFLATCQVCGRVVRVKTTEAVAVCRDRQAAQAAGAEQVVVISPGGPGTELKAILSDWLGIVPTEGCSCNSMAARMDALGPEWCEGDGMAEILGVMREEHAKRSAAGQTKLPWTDFGATQLVRLACRRARAKASA